MAPPGRRVAPNKVQKSSKSSKTFIEKYLNLEYFESLIFDPRKISIVAIVFLMAEVFVNWMVIHRVAYTEIDWKAYMQEVEGVVNGTFDYSQLKGDTGPLVYPAGFVYIFMIFYYVTSYGKNVLLAQYMFAILYIVTLILVFRLYSKSKKVPPYVLFFLCCTSYRVHSIYVLRLFNDPVAMIFLYAALNLFLDNKWNWGSLFFSLAVSIKMNILLFSPALLLSYIAILGMKRTVIQLFICASVQLVLGLPFLLANPVTYILGAFDLRRVFLYEWTVNWRFVPEDIFLSRTFHLSLLALQIVLLLYFSPSWLVYLKSFERLRQLDCEIRPQLKKKKNMNIDTSTSSQLFLTPIFICNFIGLACARSLHYQFYVWYFHSLPYLLWCTPFSTITRLSILGILELCWNTYPSTFLSSIALQCCHLVILLGLLRSQANINKTSKDASEATAAKTE